MVNQPNQDIEGLHKPSGKLVLPAPPNEGQYLQPHTVPIRPEQLIRHSAATVPGSSHGLFTRLMTLWRKDPAYRILSLAIALVVVASVVFVTLGARAFLNTNSGPTWSQAYSQHPAAPTPFGTVDNKPAFPSPSTGQGTSQSSQPPTVVPPDFQPTPTPTSDPNQPGGGNLEVQITSVPSVVPDFSTVRVGVQTSQPDALVTLMVTYSDGSPSYSRSGITNGNGNTFLLWAVAVFSRSFGADVQATVVVMAQDQNGQPVYSQQLTVIVRGPKPVPGTQ